MDSILVVNAGASSVKFEVFVVDGRAKLTRKIKGQIDGIGTLPRLRLRASGANGTSLIDREYDVRAPTALAAAVLTLMLGAAVVASGIMRLILALSMKQDKPWGWVAVSSVITLVFGLIILARWPISGLFVLGLFLGIDHLFAGARERAGSASGSACERLLNLSR
jgi:Short repeat of unknown function (DUF308)